MSIRERLASFIGEELLDLGEPVNCDENLLADGMVDSLGMLRLVAFIEAEFGTSVPPEDFVIDNFRTVEVLGRYLEARSDG
jgi:acyl carrier protein